MGAKQQALSPFLARQIAGTPAHGKGKEVAWLAGSSLREGIATLASRIPLVRRREFLGQHSDSIFVDRIRQSVQSEHR